MAHRLSSPPLIKGIDGIVSRSPNEVNYSALNEKSMKTSKQPGIEIRRKYRKFGISGNMKKDVKQEGNPGKIKILNRGVNENEIDMVENKEEDDGEEQQKSDAIMATMMAPMAELTATMAEMDRAADTKKGIKETTEKEKKEKREELYRKEKEEREEVYRKIEKEQREEFYRILSNAGVQDFWILVAKRYDIPMKDVVSDRKECDIAGEPQGNTVRRKFRKIGLKKMERNMKEGNYTGKINLTVPDNSGKIKNSTTGKDGAVKKNDGLIVKEDEIAEDEGKNAEAAAEDEENKRRG